MSARPCAGCGFTVCRCSRDRADGFRLRRVEPDPRDERIAALEAENARLEALIVEAEESWFGEDDQYSKAAVAFRTEADRIRSRV